VTYLAIGAYLVAIVTANLLTAHFGSGVSIINAFWLIGLDITLRDYLHEAWKVGRWWKLSLLIASGSLLTWIINQGAGQVAVASVVAFASALAVDSVVYHLLYKRAWWQKVNGSNIFSAGVDSVVFPTIAFGGILPWVMLGQYAAKVGGGLLWSVVIGKAKRLVAHSL
jgi:hypothetical protein